VVVIVEVMMAMEVSVRALMREMIVNAAAAAAARVVALA